MNETSEWWKSLWISTLLCNYCFVRNELHFIPNYTRQWIFLCLILHSLSHSGIITSGGMKMGRKTWRVVVVKETRERSIEKHWESRWWNKTQIIDSGNCDSCQGRGRGQELRDVPSLDSNQITQGRENSWNVQNYRWRIFRRHTLTHIRTDTRTHVKTEWRQQVKAFRNVCGKYLTFEVIFTEIQLKCGESAIVSSSRR